MTKTKLSIKWVGVPEFARDAIKADIRETRKGQKYGGSREILVCSDHSANVKAKAYIRDSLWAFRSSFILDQSRVKSSPEVVQALEKVQTELCESANEFVFALLKSFRNFCQKAVEADGRGHFLSCYDGEEHSIKVGNTTYFYYFN